VLQDSVVMVLQVVRKWPIKQCLLGFRVIIIDLDWDPRVTAHQRNKAYSTICLCDCKAIE